VEGVTPVGLRAGRAAGRPPVPAGLEEHPVRLVVGRVDLACLAGLHVDLVEGSLQSHRPGAVAGLGDLLVPAVELRIGRTGDHLKGERRRITSLWCSGEAMTSMLELPNGNSD
jgi:hypothetical protein